MDYRYIQAFYHVARELSFTKAAELLAIAPSAVTRQIKLFEQSCGKALLVRNPKHVALTKEGVELFKMIEEFRAKTGQVIKKKLAVGCLQSVFEVLLLEKFRHQAPWWRENLASVTIGTPNQLEEGLLESQLDYIFTNKAPKSKQFTFEVWGHEDYKIISSVPMTAKLLPTQTWLETPAFSSLIEQFNLRPQQTIQVNSFNAYLKMIFVGVGVGIVPKNTEVPDGLFTYTLPIKEHRQALYLVYLSGKDRSPEVKEFKRMI